MRLRMYRSGHRHTVLTVDDYDDLRDGLIVTLVTHGFDARGAASGAEALGLLTTGYRPCLLLLNLHMPDMDGWEVARAVRARPETATVPIVIVSGDIGNLPSNVEGIVAALAKPCTSGDLVATVNAHARCEV